MWSLKHLLDGLGLYPPGDLPVSSSLAVPSILGPLLGHAHVSKPVGLGHLKTHLATDLRKSSQGWVKIDLCQPSGLGHQKQPQSNSKLQLCILQLASISFFSEKFAIPNGSGSKVHAFWQRKFQVFPPPSSIQRRTTRMMKGLEGKLYKVTSFFQPREGGRGEALWYPTAPYKGAEEQCWAPLTLQWEPTPAEAHSSSVQRN